MNDYLFYYFFLILDVDASVCSDTPQGHGLGQSITPSSISSPPTDSDEGTGSDCSDEAVGFLLTTEEVLNGSYRKTKRRSAMFKRKELDRKGIHNYSYHV